MILPTIWPWRLSLNRSTIAPQICQIWAHDEHSEPGQPRDTVGYHPGTMGFMDGHGYVTLWLCQQLANWTWHFEIVDFTIVFAWWIFPVRFLWTFIPEGKYFPKHWRWWLIKPGTRGPRALHSFEGMPWTFIQRCIYTYNHVYTIYIYCNR
jgi:hypothetical protein